MKMLTFEREPADDSLEALQARLDRRRGNLQARAGNAGAGRMAAYIFTRSSVGIACVAVDGAELAAHRLGGLLFDFGDGDAAGVERRDHVVRLEPLDFLDRPLLPVEDRYDAGIAARADVPADVEGSVALEIVFGGKAERAVGRALKHQIGRAPGWTGRRDVGERHVHVTALDAVCHRLPGARKVGLAARGRH